MRTKEEISELVNNGEYNKTYRSDKNHIDPRLITVDPNHNVRDFSSFANQQHIEELAENIKENGIINPIIVRKGGVIGYDQDEKPVHMYIVVDGECRLRAVNLLMERGESIAAIPTIAERRNSNEANRVFDMLNSNIGKRFEPIELANAYRRLLNYGYTVEGIAKQMGKTVISIQNNLELLEQSVEVLNAIKDKVITANNVRTLTKKNADRGIAKEDGINIIKEKVREFRDAKEKNPGLKACHYFNDTEDVKLAKSLKTFLDKMPERINSFNREQLKTLSEYLIEGVSLEQAIKASFDEI